MTTITKKKSILLLLSVLALAGFFRLWQIGSLPGGLFPDEAANGLDIVNSIFKGEHSPFFERGLGRESLFFYLEAISIKILGIGVWQMHLVSALIGILTVLITWLFVKKLFNTRIAFWASLFMATSSWHVTLSRTGFRAIMVPLFSVSFFYFAYSTYKAEGLKKRLIFAVLSGISLALGLYSYPSFRMMALVMGTLAFFILLANWRIFKNCFKEIIIGLIAFSLVIAPLALYFFNHPDSFAGRAGYVSVFNKDMNHGDLLGTVLKVAEKTALMFFTQGDLNWRHNTSEKSMLNPVTAAFFAFGLIICLIMIFGAFIRKKLLREEFIGNYLKYLFLLAWLVIMLIPQLLTAESIPHGLRSIGAMPVVFIISALGLNFVYKKARHFIRPRLLFVILSFFLILGALYDFRLYFNISANSPDFYYAYRSDLTTVSQYLSERNLKDQTYLVLDTYSVQTPEFLTSDSQQPYILFNPEMSYQISWKKGDQAVFTQSTIYDATKFKQYHPEAELVKQDFNRFGQEIMRVYQY